MSGGAGNDRYWADGCQRTRLSSYRTRDTISSMLKLLLGFAAGSYVDELRADRSGPLELSGNDLEQRLNGRTESQVSAGSKRG